MGLLILRRGGLVLHVVASPDVDPLTTAGMCFASVDDADAVHAAWRDVVPPGTDPATGSRLTEPADTAYGMREFALMDPSGNLVRVGSPLPG
ncbi:hypothetical protein [Cellulomonas sp. ATA003]|uniref:hypothetical protein n=1 Tax=Cellulomonas sp. ATA003 TaxID=3073064 RepID=UPI0028739000|nr:hypothetical protein [Cellulomonas sp. ATA003]WNB84912.1 hypothetical protein REH70_14525 [Cellulomonas sp. ATA003]